MARVYLRPEYRITTLGVDCGKSSPSVSRAHFNSSSSFINRFSWSIPSLEQSNSPKLAAQSTFNRQIRLQNLPYELIDYILSFLDNCGPSLANYAARPSLNLTQSIPHPLKCLSLTCHTLRSLTIPRLFSFTCLDPATLSDFLSFIRSHDLNGRVFSVVAILKVSDKDHLTHPLWWARLLKTLPNVRWFSILAPPLELGSLMSISVPKAEVWAFNMPYHLLRLRRVSSPSTSENDVGVYPTEPSLFTFSEWDHLTLNEGSSLKAYSLYEYFLRKTPSLLASLKTNSEPSDLASQAASALFERLQSFTYIAIFPFYNHVDNVLKHVRRMTNLRTFVTQLSTRADVDAISDEHVDETRKVDMNDCWMELTTAYDLILHTVLYLAQEGQLQRWEAKDVSSISGIKDELVCKMEGRLGTDWIMESEGVWTRAPDTTPPAAMTFSDLHVP